MASALGELDLNWVDFCVLIRKKFCPEAIKAALYEELHTLHQTKTITKYNDRFKEFVCRATILPIRELTTCYVDGLKDGKL